MVIIALKLLLVVCFCGLYALGGQGHKQFRRFLLPLSYIILCSLIMWIKGVVQLLPYLSLAPILISCNPPVSYGEKFTHNKLGLKLLFRGICGLFFGLSSATTIALLGNPLQIVVASAIIPVIISATLGSFNPFPKSWGNWATITEDICIALSYIGLLTIVI